MKTIKLFTIIICVSLLTVALLSHYVNSSVKTVSAACGYNDPECPTPEPEETPEDTSPPCICTWQESCGCDGNEHNILKERICKYPSGGDCSGYTSTCYYSPSDCGYECEDCRSTTPGSPGEGGCDEDEYPLFYNCPGCDQDGDLRSCLPFDEPEPTDNLPPSTNNPTSIPSSACGDGSCQAGETCEKQSYWIYSSSSSTVSTGYACNNPYSSKSVDCRDNCTYCGDGIKNANESCDDGNTNNYDDCTNGCKTWGDCGKFDVVIAFDKTGSMLNSIESMKNKAIEIVNMINMLSDNDYRIGLISFDDAVTIEENFNQNNGDAVKAKIANLTTALSVGGGPAEASDIAIEQAINQFQWRSEEANKVVILITDAPLGGANDGASYFACPSAGGTWGGWSGCSEPAPQEPYYYKITAGQQRVDQVANLAKTKAIKISSIFVTNSSMEDFQDITAAQMSRYAEKSGGVYRSTGGGNVGAEILDVIEECGSPIQLDCEDPIISPDSAEHEPGSMLNVVGKAIVTGGDTNKISTPSPSVYWWSTPGPTATPKPTPNLNYIWQVTAGSITGDDDGDPEQINYTLPNVGGLTSAISYYVTDGSSRSRLCSATVNTKVLVSTPTPFPTFSPIATSLVSWWQVGAGNVYTGSDEGGDAIKSILPGGEFLFSLGGTGSWEYGNPNYDSQGGGLGEGGVVVQSGNYEGNVYDYTYWKDKLADYTNNETYANYGKIYSELDISTISADGIYRVETIAPYLELSASTGIDKQIAILYEGQVIVVDNIRITRNDGIFILVNGGTRNSDGSYPSTNKGTIDISPTVSNLHGFYIADKEISTGTNLTSPDVQLIVKGGLVSWTGVNLERDLEEGNSQPGELLTQNLEMVNALKVTKGPLKAFRIYKYSWQEIKP